jgi:hypothetical protein
LLEVGSQLLKTTKEFGDRFCEELNGERGDCRRICSGRSTKAQQRATTG